MRNHSRVRALTRSVLGLFKDPIVNVTFKNHRDDYYKAYWFRKNICEGIELTATINRETLKNTAEMLMERGLASFIGEKLGDYIKSDEVAEKLEQKTARNRFIIELKRYARDKGMDISKFL